MEILHHNRNTERMTQDRVIRLFKEKLEYEYFGSWHTRPNNSNIAEEYLTRFLSKQGHSKEMISRTLDLLSQTIHQFDKKLYQRNKEFYSKLRYGVVTKIEAGMQNETIALIDWKHPENNHFAIAEEVTIEERQKNLP